MPQFLTIDFERLEYLITMPIITFPSLAILIIVLIGS